jgi:hypothetical protein
MRVLYFEIRSLAISKYASNNNCQNMQYPHLIIEEIIMLG